MWAYSQCSAGVNLCVGLGTRSCWLGRIFGSFFRFWGTTPKSTKFGKPHNGCVKRWAFQNMAVMSVHMLYPNEPVPKARRRLSVLVSWRSYLYPAPYTQGAGRLLTLPSPFLPMKAMHDGDAANIPTRLKSCAWSVLPPVWSSGLRHTLQSFEAQRARSRQQVANSG